MTESYRLSPNKMFISGLFIWTPTIMWRMKSDISVFVLILIIEFLIKIFLIDCSRGAWCTQLSRHVYYVTFPDDNDFWKSNYDQWIIIKHLLIIIKLPKVIIIRKSEIIDMSTHLNFVLFSKKALLKYCSLKICANFEFICSLNKILDKTSCWVYV